MRAAFREPQRPLLFALAVLIHAGLFQLLASQQHAIPQALERHACAIQPNSGAGLDGPCGRLLLLSSLWSRCASASSARLRVEAIEGGGILVRINDRCAIVITLLAMPVCQIGKKPARGDLFEHLDDAPTPGDWKDE
jgi:hypothetical protein